MKICVTGGAGMIGSALVRALIEQKFDVVVIDNFWRGKKENLIFDGFNHDSKLFNIDLSDSSNEKSIISILSDCDAVIHLADIVAGIGYVFNNQYDIFKINNQINTNLFSWAAFAGIKKILYAGTACSFPQQLQSGLEAVLKEIDMFPSDPESAYGWSKLLGSLELRYLSEKFNILTSTLVLHNVYGPFCDFESERSQVIPSLIKRLISLDDQGTLTVWGSGSQGRAFLHVNDVVSAFILALKTDSLPELIQIGPNHCTSIKELSEKLIKVSEKSINIEFDLSKPEGDKGRYADYSLAKEILGWEPTTNLEDGLLNTYNWIKSKL